MPQFRARSLSRCGRSARCRAAETSKARERERKFEDKAMTVEFNAQQNERTVSMTEHLHTRSNVVEPGEYEKHFALLRDAHEVLGRRLLVGVSARDAAHQRDRRLENLMRDVLKDAHDKPAGEHR